MRRAPHDISKPAFWWVFGLFNLIMVAWTAFYFVTGRTSVRAPGVVGHSGAEAAGAIGAPMAGDLGLGFLLMLWLLGFIILGVCGAFTVFRRRDSRVHRQPVERL